MLIYEGCFGEKGFEEDCEIEWERKTIAGNVCIGAQTWGAHSHTK